jgi:hypothetical protein
MNWLQMLAGGQQQPQAMQMDNPYAAQMAFDNAQQERQRAMQMQQPQYQGGGASGILAGLLSILGGKQLEKRANETATQALQRQFEYQNKAAQAQAEQAAAEEERKFQRDLERDRKKLEAAAANRPKTALDYLPEGERERAARISQGLELGAQAPQRVTYGAPVEVVGPDGKPMLIRPGSDGSMQPIQGFAPRPQAGNVPAGYQPTPDGKLAFIPGGPADPARPVPVAGEQAARLAMGEVFLSKAPQILEEIKAGALTGPYDANKAALGYGRQGEISRQLASGSDALLRNLTGAGMSNTEAEKYVARYQESRFDTAETLYSKVSQLREELQAYKDKLAGGAAPAGPSGSVGVGGDYQAIMAKYGL